MKIIDSNKDFYDYYQNIYIDDALTFDRRDSYVLSKDEFASHFCNDYARTIWGDYNTKHFVMLQVGHSFWLFRLTITKEDRVGQCIDYRLDVIDHGKNYQKRELIKLSVIDFNWKLRQEDNAAKYITAFNIGDFRELKVFNKFPIYKGNCCYNEAEIRHIPILKNIGIPALVDAFEIYNSLEEYFSEEKTASERSEAIGTTNNDKITSHGFDLKKSFRGKRGNKYESRVGR